MVNGFSVGLHRRHIDRWSELGSQDCSVGDFGDVNNEYL
jgi:hypothetical protein